METCVANSAPAKPWLFTSANAKELSAKAHKARWHTPKAQECPSDKNASQTALPKDTFTDETLTRVRKQIEAIANKIDDQLDADDFDSKVLKELTESLARLETIEQKLSMRSAPAAMKPATQKQSKSKASHASPMVIEETPAAPINDPNEPNG